MKPSSLAQTTTQPPIGQNPEEPKDDLNSYRNIPLKKFEISHHDSYKSTKEQSTAGSRETFGDLPSIISKQESVTSMEQTTAKDKIRLLHGKHFGRSLTQDEELQKQDNKFNMKLVFIILLLMFGIMVANTMLNVGNKKESFNKETWKTWKPKKSDKIRKKTK